MEGLGGIYKVRLIAIYRDIENFKIAVIE